MPNTAKVSAQVEPELKRQAEARFKEWGMTVDEAITQFYERVAGGYCSDPFSPHIPNAETIEAMNEGKHREALTQVLLVRVSFWKRWTRARAITS